MGRRTSRRQGQEEQSFRPRYYRAYYRGNKRITVALTVLPQLLPRRVRRNTVVVTVVAAVLPRQSRYYRAACAQIRAYGPCIRVWTTLDYKYKSPYEFLG